LHQLFQRLLKTFAWEVLGLSLLVAFVVAICTMPPLNITPNPKYLTGYRVRVETTVWKERLGDYWQTIRSGSLGTDRRGFPVAEVLPRRVGNSLKLMSISLGLALLIGTAKGIRDFHQLRKGRVSLGPVLTGLIQGLPDFWLVLLIQVLAVALVKNMGWRPFPVAYMDEQPIRSLVYPVFCLFLVPMAYIARITSTAMTSVYEKEYVRTARAKGLAEPVVIFRHVIRTAVVQIMDGLPNALAVMFSNLLVIESMFYYPGITTLLKEAANPLSLNWVDPRRMDVPPDTDVLIAAGVTLGLIFALLYFIIAVLRPFFDPRVREREES
jgi:peptide/nickel transport system permease protein